MKHILLWLPLFGYISYKGQKLTENWWKIIIMLGLTIIVIHLYLYLNKLGILFEIQERKFFPVCIFRSYSRMF